MIRTKVVHVRLSDDEFVALRAFSADAGLSVSEVLRRLSRQSGGLELGDEVASVIKSYIREIWQVTDDLDEIMHVLRGRKEPRFDVLIHGMVRLARLVSDHAVEIQAMCGSSLGRVPEVVTCDV